jgi:hypothetical protein
MAYTDFRGLATVLSNGPPIKATTTAAVKTGDLLDKLFALADASAGKLPAYWVALEDGASGDVVSVAKWAVLRKPSTIAAGGGATAGSHSGTLGDMLWLSTTAGAAVEVIDGDGIYQVVGHVLSTQDVFLEPSFAPGDFFEDCEKETAAKTVDINDSGKVIVCTSTTDIVVTMTATAAEGNYTIINGAQAGDHLTSVDPVAGDGVAGWDSGNVDNKDMLNTKATSQPGDYLTLGSGGLAGGLYIFGGRGVWASEA